MTKRGAATEKKVKHATEQVLEQARKPKCVQVKLAFALQRFDALGRVRDIETVEVMVNETSFGLTLQSFADTIEKSPPQPQPVQQGPPQRR